MPVTMIIAALCHTGRQEEGTIVGKSSAAMLGCAYGRRFAAASLSPAPVPHGPKVSNAGETQESGIAAAGTNRRATVTLMVMTLDEIDGMKLVMPRIDTDTVDQILIVDGGSTDGTVEWARARGYTVVEQERPGLREGYNAAFPHAEGDLVVTFSPDGNSIPELLPALVERMQDGSDMVIVSRYLDGAKSEDDDAITAFGNWLFTRCINLLHGGHYTDAMVIYRGYKRQLYYDLGLDRDDAYRPFERLFSTNMSIEPLLSIRAAKRRLAVSEIPGDEPKRIGGVRKLRIVRWGSAYFLQMLREIYYWK